METAFAGRMAGIRKSFIREILKVTADPQVISFAGGLPNPSTFPTEAIAKAAQSVLVNDGNGALQYSTTEGSPVLRRLIAQRYRDRMGLEVDPESILITNGSQQALDLIGKVFLDRGDGVILERPGYLGAIQALSIFEPRFLPVALNGDGPDTAALAEKLRRRPKLFYAVPNFQNPSGITYSREKREETARLLKGSGTLFIEDDPYGELRFRGEECPSMRAYLGDECILLGSFSKIVAPAMRLGWISAPPRMMEKLLIAKQAADLHTNFFAQKVVERYLLENDLDEHIRLIRQLYQGQKERMADAARRHLPSQVRLTDPEGGMFMWAQLPEGLSSLELFELASARNVAFVPGAPFYTDRGGENTLRLNYTNSNEEEIEEGMRRLGESIAELLSRPAAGKGEMFHAENL